MTITVRQIREMASHSTVEVVMHDGRTFMIHAPENVGGSPNGRQLMLPCGGEGLQLVEADEIADVRIAIPNTDVESLRRGEVPAWLMARMREQPDVFVKMGRMGPAELAQVLGRIEGGLGE